jgi:serine/threonine protein kinase
MGACLTRTEIQKKTPQSNFNTDKSTFYTDRRKRLWKVHTEPNEDETEFIYNNNIAVSKLAPHCNLLIPTSVIRQNKNTVLLCMSLGQTDLFNIIKQPFDWTFVEEELSALSSAILYLHDNGIAHRDIKPENVVLYCGRLCLIDFDFAGPVYNKSHCGTPFFKCPIEVTSTWDCCDTDFSKRCDVYAFGKLILAIFWQASAHGMVQHRRFIFDAFHADFVKDTLHPFTGTWGKWATIAMQCISKVPPISIPTENNTETH